MKIKKEIVVCDLCKQRESSLRRCKVCRKQYCFVCSASYENTFDLDVCKRCETLPTVRKLIERYLNKWRNAAEKGNKELQKIKLRNEKKLLKKEE